MGDLDLFDAAKRLQEDYWRPDEKTRQDLLSRPLESLPWPELLRLHHLNGLELVRSCRPDPLRKPDEESDPVPGPARDLALRLLDRLTARESPFRPRHLFLWQGKPGESGRREPDRHGIVRNASLSHLGCLEVIHLDKQNRPTSIDFVPFDSLCGAVFANPAVFRLGKLFYDDGRPDEIVLFPLLYGISWSSPNRHDQDGTLTRFCGHIVSEKAGRTFGIGIGHQDLAAADPKKGGEALVGLGSVAEIMVGLEIDDPRFEGKCRARGLDPEAVRRQAKGP